MKLRALLELIKEKDLIITLFIDDHWLCDCRVDSELLLSYYDLCIDEIEPKYLYINDEVAERLYVWLVSKTGGIS